MLCVCHVLRYSPVNRKVHEQDIEERLEVEAKENAEEEVDKGPR